MYGQLQKFVASFRKEIKALNLVNYDEIKEEVYVGNETENSFYLGKEVEIDEISFDREGSDDELDLNPDFIEE